MAMSAGDSGDDALAEINVTPMTDVLLCLLIIFMVAQPSKGAEQIPLSVPQDAVVQNPADPNAALLVTIDVDGNAKLGETPLSRDYDEMIEQFKKNPKAQADDKLVISAEDKTKYGRVIRVMAAAHEAGISEVGIASKKL